jgi:cardiolipin synthase A/B
MSFAAITDDDALGLWPLIRDFWVWGLAITGFLFELGCAIHAILNKRETRSTIAWVGIIWLTPLIGAVLYILFGVNRIQRRAKQMRRRHHYSKNAPTDDAVTPTKFVQLLGKANAHWMPHAHLVEQLAEQPLLEGNAIEPLFDGDQAYPAMLAAIEQATSTITLCTYIFDRDAAGAQFIQALTAAVQRGVQVKILIDDVGSRYSIPTVIGPLRQGGCHVERFLPTLWPTGFAYSNLRTHRKILVIDGRMGFTGGMNIRAGCYQALKTKHAFHDLHFRCQGPVVSQLQEAFAEDWKFTTGELLEGESWFPNLEPVGSIMARGIPTGPDEDIGELRSAIIGALALAQERVSIITPYFIPDEALSEALNVAALRGVQVEIILPEENNLSLVKWASLATLPAVLERGCRVWLQPGQFHHTKLLVVDSLWSLIGSANLDPRSLRLNFEFNVECYDSAFGQQLEMYFQSQLKLAKPITMADLAAMSFLSRLRNGIARLFTPLL